MAGVGIKLNRIFEKQSLAAHAYGFGYSAVITVAPMFVVIGAIIGAQLILRYDTVDYYNRELFADTILYIFIFSLLSASPFNAVLSRYLSDVIFEERYEDIMPCYYLGLAMSVGLGSLVSVPFCIHEYMVGQVPLYYVFTGFCGFMSLLLVFYSLLYLSITKDYGKISAAFIAGMLLTLILGILLVRRFEWEISYALLFSLVCGFMMTASLETAIIHSYFRRNSCRYRPVLRYFRQYWQLVLVNFLYTLGLYIHHFVFWTTDMHTVLAKSFVTMMSYDMATCLAMFTNISATVIFISRVEMHVHDRYKAYSEAVIGGLGQDIRNSRQRMFMQLGSELMTLARTQFIITVVVFLLMTILLPWLGINGEIMRIYPCLCVGFFILFIMYAEILFLYYFNDMKGALLTAASFCAVTLIGAAAATHLPQIWFGAGLVAGSFTGFTAGYFRLRWVERNLDVHIFCSGRLMKKGEGIRPPGKVFDRRLGITAAPAMEHAGPDKKKGGR